MFNQCHFIIKNLWIASSYGYINNFLFQLQMLLNANRTKRKFMVWGDSNRFKSPASWMRIRRISHSDGGSTHPEKVSILEHLWRPEIKAPQRTYRVLKMIMDLWYAGGATMSEGKENPVSLPSYPQVSKELCSYIFNIPVFLFILKQMEEEWTYKTMKKRFFIKIGRL